MFPRAMAGNGRTLLFHLCILLLAWLPACVVLHAVLYVRRSCVWVCEGCGSTVLLLGACANGPQLF